MTTPIIYNSSDNLNLTSQPILVASMPKSDAIATTSSMNLENNLTSELSAQLEYYFSYQNLSKDDFLRSKMAQHEGYAPVELIAGFNHVVKIFLMSSEGRLMLSLSKERALQLRSEMLLEAAAASKVLAVAPLVTNQDGSVLVWGIGPKLDAATEVMQDEIIGKQRHKIIFRGVPKGVTKEDISSVIQRASGDLHSYIEEIYEDVGDCWFVLCKEDLEDKSMIAECIIQMRQMDLKGQTIKARLKTETIKDFNEEVLAVPTFWPSSSQFSASNERRRTQRKGRKNDKNHSPQNGGSAKQNNRRHGSSNPATSKQNSRPPPDVNDSHFPILGKNGNGMPKKTQSNSTESTKEVPVVKPSPTSVAEKKGTKVCGVHESPEDVKGAYAAALLRQPNSNVNSAKESAVAAPVKTEASPVKETNGCRVRGRSIVNNGSSDQSGTNIIQKEGTDYIVSHDKVPNRDKADASACSVDNEEVTEKTASTTLSISSASSSSTPMQIASSWGGLKKSFADIVKAQGIDG